MDIYKVNISSIGDGWSDYKSVQGEIYEEGGVITVKYSLDGDECVLTVKDGKAVQERKGGQCVKISFQEGKRTKCEIGSGSFYGSYEILTKRLKFICGKGGYKLLLEYENGSAGELIELTLTAVKILK